MRAFVIVLFALSLSGCATKEKAETGSRELLHTSYIQNTGTESVTVMQDSTRQSCVAETESETDSVVRKIHERIVMDSCGRVIAHEKILSQERYKGAGKRKAFAANKQTVHAKNNINKHAAVIKDSLSEAQSMQNNTVKNKPPVRWVFLYILTIIIICYLVGGIDKKTK